VPVNKRNNDEARRHLKNLERRLDFLDERILTYVQRKGQPAEPNWDLAERGSIAWAIGIVRRWMSEDPLFDCDYTGVLADTATPEELADMLGTEARFQGKSVEIMGARAFERKGRRTIRFTLRRRSDAEVRGEDRSRPLRKVGPERSMGSGSARWLE